MKKHKKRKKKSLKLHELQRKYGGLRIKDLILGKPFRGK
jgi:hypothetical protein